MVDHTEIQEDLEWLKDELFCLLERIQQEHNQNNFENNITILDKHKWILALGILKYKHELLSMFNKTKM